MFDGVIYLLARDHDRELLEAAERNRPGRLWESDANGSRRRRLAAELKLLRVPARRG